MVILQLLKAVRVGVFLVNYTEEQLELMTKEQMKAIILECQETDICKPDCESGIKGKLIEFNKELLIHHGVSAPVAAFIATATVCGLFNLFYLIPLLYR